MPRNGQSMMFGGASATYLLSQSISVNNTNIFPVASTSEEKTQFAEVRTLIAETMARIIRRDPDTNGILAGIAMGRSKLGELSASG